MSTNAPHGEAILPWNFKITTKLRNAFTFEPSLISRPIYIDQVPITPLKPLPKLIFFVSEFPILIMLTYCVYWLQVCWYLWGSTPSLIWAQAAVAGILVGIGLNANAIKALRRPISRVEAYVRLSRSTAGKKSSGYEIHNPQQQRLKIFYCTFSEIASWNEDCTRYDYGVIARFFLIPFAVSSLSSIASHHRRDFWLVFPRDPYLLAQVVIPEVLIVIALLAVRLYFVLCNQIKPITKSIFFNGKLLL